MSAISRLAAAVTLCAASLSAVAEEAPRYNQVSLHAEVSQQVAHDLMQVTLYSENQGSDPAKLAAETTSVLNAAVADARKVKGVTISLGSRNSYPVYDDKGQKITGWRERAELRLESSDFAALGQLSADLLGKLKMGGMDFSIADATRKKNEDQLMKGAVDAFKERAPVAHRGARRQGLQAGQPEREQRRRTAPVPGDADGGDEGRRQLRWRPGTGDRGRDQPGHGQRRRCDRGADALIRSARTTRGSLRAASCVSTVSRAANAACVAFAQIRKCDIPFQTDNNIYTEPTSTLAAGTCPA
ncbi:periplasmic/secreted protein [Pseudomonas aeruginosa]|nr:periplasmic/secreted protein [Pseudomonas aeruginosa]